ncbi:hypothetical protein Hanom_Chr07g00644251 [Helianthus anomalus]
MKHLLVIAKSEVLGRQTCRDLDFNFKHSKQKLWLTFRLHWAMAYTVSLSTTIFLVEAA